MDFVCLDAMRPFPLCGVAEMEKGPDSYAGAPSRTAPIADKQTGAHDAPFCFCWFWNGGRADPNSADPTTDSTHPNAPKSIEG